MYTLILGVKTVEHQSFGTRTVVSIMCLAFFTHMVPKRHILIDHFIDSDL